MKVLSITIFITCIIMIQAVSDELKQKYKTHKAECITETGATEELIKKTHEGEFPDDEHLEEFFFCLFKGMEIMKEDGDYDIDAMKTIITKEHGEELAETIIKECASDKPGDGKANALHLAKCYHEHAPDHDDLD